MTCYPLVQNERKRTRGPCGNTGSSEPGKKSLSLPNIRRSSVVGAAGTHSTKRSVVIHDNFYSVLSVIRIV